MSSPHLTAALDLAARGFPVLPLHDPTSGRCSCGRSDCSSPGKHPRTEHGLNDATTNPDTINFWWTSWPKANIGVRTDGLLVLDQDDRHDGDATLARLVEAHGELPETPEVRTGGGGRHVYLLPPRGGVRCSAGTLGPGLDVRGVGGYVVAPPSLHASGDPYAWIVTLDECGFAPTPDWLLDLIARPADAGSGGLNETPAASNCANSAIPEGRRHTELLRIAGAMRRVGATDHELLAALQAANATRCQPPLPDREVVSLGKDVARRYEPDPSVEQAAPPPSWEPYPLDALPFAIRDLAREGAGAIGCDPAYVALPALVACAGSIGLSRDVRIKNGKKGWREPSVLWGCVVGESGTAKSPALDLAEGPVLELESAARRAYERAVVGWRQMCRLEEAAAKEEKRKPDLPPKPVCQRRIAKDATIEALARILPETPRGVAVIRDELAAWFRSWGEYKAHASGDAAKWLELYGARALIVDRVLAGGSVYIERAAVSVVGGTQPGVLQRVLSPEHLESGCAARILFAFPPRSQRQWRDEEITDETTDAYARVVRALTLLAPRKLKHADGGSSLAPEGVRLSAAARRLFCAWVDELGEEALDYAGAEAATASKIEGAAARFALVFELVDAAAGPLAAQAIAAEDAAAKAETHAGELATAPMGEGVAVGAEEPKVESSVHSPTAGEGAAVEGPKSAVQEALDAVEAANLVALSARCAADRAVAAWGAAVSEISGDAMRRAIVLARWHWEEARRVLSLLREDGDGGKGENRALRELVEFVERRGGSATARDLARGPRRFRAPGGAARAEAALDELVKLGVGDWVYDEQGGRPGPSVKRFRMFRGSGGGEGGDAFACGDPTKAQPVADASVATQNGVDPDVEADARRKKWGAGS